MSFSSRRLGLLGWVIGLALFGCGDDDGDTRDPAEARGDDASNAGSDGGANSGDDGVGSDTPPAGDAPGNTPPGSDDGSDAGFPGPGATPPNVEPPEPILPDVDGETPLSDLEEDEVEQVCEAYLETADQFVGRFEGLCGFMGLAVVGELDSPTDAEFQAACHEAREGCRLDAEAGQLAVAGAQCGQVSDCEVTVEQFNECNTQLHLLDQAILEPLSAAEVPACDDLSAAQAELKYFEVMLTLLATVEDTQGLASLFEGGSACETIDEQCPEYSIPIGDFALPQ